MIVAMPDGQHVDFGSLPPDQIKGLIASKYPDAISGSGGTDRLAGGDSLDRDLLAPVPSPTAAAPPSPAAATPGPSPGPSLGGDSLDRDLLAPTMSTGEDVARSVGTGLARGAVGLAGTPGDVAAGIGHGIGFLAEKVGLINPGERETFAKGLSGSLPIIGGMPTTDEISGAISSVSGALGGPTALHEPVTTAGKYAETAAEFVPAAVGLGPGGLARGAAKAGANALKYGVAPGLASEAAGQATKGSPYEPYARTGAALATGGAAGLARLPAKAPAIAAIKDSSQALYDAANNAGVALKDYAWARVAGNVIGTAKREGFSEVSSKSLPAVTDAAKTLESMVGTTPTLEKIDQARRVIGNAVASSDPNERRIGLIMMHRLDENLRTVTALPSNIAGVNHGDARQAVAYFEEARKLWSQQLKAKMVEKLADDANLNTRIPGEYPQKLADQFRSLAKDRDALRMFSKDEVAIIRQIAKGVPPLRWAARLAPNSPFSAIWQMSGAGGLGYMTSGGNPAIAGGAAFVPYAIGSTAKGIDNLMTRRAFGDLSATTRGAAAPPSGPLMLPMIGVESNR